MQAIKFDEANRVLTKPAGMTDEECSSLDVYTNGSLCISCWTLNSRERVRALLHGRIWLGVLSGDTQPPVWIDCRKTVFVKERK